MMYVKDFINTFDNKNDSSLFIQKKSFELRTIYEYLNAFENIMKDYSLIKLKPNNYIAASVLTIKIIIN